MQVAIDTGVGQVLGAGLATVLLADHVIDLAAKPSIRFMDQAVFAKPVCASDDEPPQLSGDVARH